MNFYTLDQLRVENLPAPQPIIEGLLNEGETILLAGRPKAGKSRLVQQGTLAIARGRPFLDHFAVPQAKNILLVDLENRPAGVKARFTAMSPPHGSDQRIWIYAPDTLSEGGLSPTFLGIKNLEYLIQKSAADVVIIDTWRLFVGGDENDSRVTVDALKCLSEIRQNKPRLAQIIVHHLRKDKTSGAIRLREDPYTWVESVSGHHALVSHVDACFGLEREIDGNGDELIVFGGVARSAATSALLLEEDDQTLRFTVKSGYDAAVGVMTAAELSIWNHAHALNRFTFTELLRDANTTNRKAVTRMLRKALAHNALRKEGDKYVVQP